MIRIDDEHTQQPDFTHHTPVEVLLGMKQVCVKITTNLGDQEVFALFRPEKTLLASDNRVPLPQELYRDVCYSDVCQSLGWSVAAPVIVTELNGAPGVLRPYYQHPINLQHYDFTPELLTTPQAEFWLQVAVLDYITGVVDRNSNDFLVVQPDDSIWKLVPAQKHSVGNVQTQPSAQPETVVIDSGLSFVEGTEFATQNSVVRNALQGTTLPGRILNDISCLQPGTQLAYRLANHLSKAELESFHQRVERILQLKQVL